MARPIDIHEEQILEVLHLMEFEGQRYDEALFNTADIWRTVSEDRLDHLVRVWCGIAGCSDLLP